MAFAKTMWRHLPPSRSEMNAGESTGGWNPQGLCPLWRTVMFHFSSKLLAIFAVALVSIPRDCCCFANIAERPSNQAPTITAHTSHCGEREADTCRRHGTPPRNGSPMRGCVASFSLLTTTTKSVNLTSTDVGVALTVATPAESPSLAVAPGHETSNHLGLDPSLNIKFCRWRC
jgi:hypothetical protein